MLKARRRKQRTKKRLAQVAKQEKKLRKEKAKAVTADAP
jgi:hypothetical protein